MLLGNFPECGKSDFLVETLCANVRVGDVKLEVGETVIACCIMALPIPCPWNFSATATASMKEPSCWSVMGCSNSLFIGNANRDPYIQPKLATKSFLTIRIQRSLSSVSAYIPAISPSTNAP